VGKNTQDLILANDELVVRNVSPNLHLGHSNHCAVDFSCPVCQ